MIWLRWIKCLPARRLTSSTRVHLVEMDHAEVLACPAPKLLKAVSPPVA